MKTIFLLINLLFLPGFVVRSQDTVRSLINLIDTSRIPVIQRSDSNHIFLPIVKRGKITFADGSVSRFRKLSSLEDTIFFADPNSIQKKYALADISSISETKSTVDKNALIFGGLGLIIGGSAATIQRLGFGEWLTLKLNKESKDDILSWKDVPTIFVYTALGTAIGSLIGVIATKNKNVYKAAVPLSFQPGLFFDQKKEPALMLTMKINFGNQ